MDIRAAMVEYALLKNGEQVELVGDPERPVSCVRAYRRGVHEEGVLYVSFEKPDGKRIAGSGSMSVIQWKTDSRQDRSKPSDRTEKLASCIEAAYDALRLIDSWESQLKDALLKGVSLDEFLEIGQQMFSCPMAYFDRNLIVLAATKGYWEHTAPIDTADAVIAVEGQIPPSRAIDLVEDLDYLHAAEKREGFYYEDTRQRMHYGINTFDENEYLARLVFPLLIGERELHRGEEQLIDRYHRYLDDLHLRYAGNASVVSSQNDSLHALVRASTMTDEVPDRGEAAAVVASHGWSLDDDFVIAKLVFFEGVHWDSVSLYLCALLERMMGASCALPFDQQIVWMANLTRAARMNETKQQVTQRFVGSLVDLLRNYACKAGISNAFSDFAEARDFYLEAEYALEFGQVRDPHYWYYWFKDYVFDFLLVRGVADFSPEQVCHPALAMLLAEDARNGTEYARTLVCYLRNSQNTTHAANELFIHRTSFMRRMAQLEKLVNVDLSDSDQVLHLLLSAKLLGM